MLQLRHIITFCLLIISTSLLAQNNQPNSDILIRDFAKNKQYGATNNNCVTCKWFLIEVNQREPLAFDNVPFTKLINKKTAIFEIAEQSLSKSVSNEGVQKISGSSFETIEQMKNSFVLLSKQKNSLQQKALVKLYSLPGYGKVIKEVRLSTINLRSGVETLDYTFQFYNFKQ